MHGLVQATLEASSKGKQLLPEIKTSKNYKHWVSIEDSKRCIKATPHNSGVRIAK